MVKKYTKEILLQKLKDWQKKHNKSPTFHDLKKDESMPDVSTYIR